MNTLRIRKGEDVKISVDKTQLFFVTGFYATQSSDRYSIKEFLSEDAVECLSVNNKYTITITAYSHLDKSVFDKESFTLSVDDGESVVQYLGCSLISTVCDVFASKPITNKFVIEAACMKTSEG